MKQLQKDFNALVFLPDYCEDIETAMGYYDGEKDADAFCEWYQETYVFDASVIYYTVAADFLRENDPSFYESMQLAAEMGYEVQNLNSETLATLLLQEKLREDLYNLRDSLEDYFERLAQ